MLWGKLAPVNFAVKDIRRSMPEPLVALQINAPRFFSVSTELSPA